MLTDEELRKFTQEIDKLEKSSPDVATIMQVYFMSILAGVDDKFIALCLEFGMTMIDAIKYSEWLDNA